MSRLIDELQIEHDVLVARLTEVKNSIDPKTGKLPMEQAVATLTLVKKALLAHLAKEDEKLYPALKEAAASDPQLRLLLKTFGDDMSNISTAALAFFEKYGKSGLFSKEFPIELTGLMEVLVVRINAEQRELYPAYERVMKKLGKTDAASGKNVATKRSGTSRTFWTVSLLSAVGFAVWRFLLT